MRGRGSKLAKANKHPLNQLCREKMEEAGEGVNGGAQYHHQAIALTLYGSEEMWDYSLLEEKFTHMERYGDPLESLKDMLDAGPRRRVLVSDGRLSFNHKGVGCYDDECKQ